MNKLATTLVLSILTGLLLSHNAAAAFEAECPEEVKTRQAALPPPKGWTAHVEAVNARQIFTGLELTNGHPKDGGTPLFADEVPAGKPAAAPEAPVETVYTLPAGREVFISCQYSNTLVRLIGKIPKTAKTCRVRFSATLGHVQKAICE